MLLYFLKKHTFSFWKSSKKESNHKLAIVTVTTIQKQRKLNWVPNGELTGRGYCKGLQSSAGGGQERCSRMAT